MCCLDYAERSHPGNQLSFMLHELVFLGCHLQFASYLYMFALYWHSYKLLQPYVAATVWMHSDVTFSSIGASRTKNIQHQISMLVKNSVSLQTTVGSDAPDGFM